MTERLSHELVSLLAEDDGGLERVEARGLLRARLAQNIAEGLGQEAPSERGGDEAGAIDCGRVAAYLDCSLSRAERDAVAVQLANDPVVRSEVVSAVLLLDGLEARTAAVPAEVIARAVGILAPARPVAPLASSLRHAPLAIWWRGPAAWSGIAAILLVAALTPAVVSMVRDGQPSLRDVKGAPVDRGVVPSPTRKVKEPDTRLCDDPSDPVRKPPRRSVEPGMSGDRPADPSSAVPDDDPCPPKPATKGGPSSGGRD
jgi:hypothetical protein